MPISPTSGDARLTLVLFELFFFFSSRRRHTRFDCDWSSDVCSSDLLVSGFFTSAWAPGATLLSTARSQFATLDLRDVVLVVGGVYAGAATNSARSEERRVGKECRSRWSPYH